MMQERSVGRTLGRTRSRTYFGCYDDDDYLTDISRGSCVRISSSTSGFLEVNMRNWF